MKIKSVIMASFILLFSLQVSALDVDKSEILNVMEFPEPDLRFGSTINNPFFTINIRSRIVNISETEQLISGREKELTNKTEPEIFYEIGSYYKDLGKNEKATNYYKKYLKAEPSIYSLNEEPCKNIIIKGDIFFSLSEIDIKTDKIDNLDKALLYLTKAIELNPEDIQQWTKLGDCYLSIGKTTEASYCYNKVLEKKNDDFQIYPRLQAAQFERDFLKLSENSSKDKVEDQQIIEGFNFDYIQTAINNSPADSKDSLKLQQYIYLLRLLILKSELHAINSKADRLDFNRIFSKNEKVIITDAGNFLKTFRDKNISNLTIDYLNGIVLYLNSDYEKAIAIFKEVLNKNENSKLIDEDVIFIVQHFLNDESKNKETITDIIKMNPEPEFYLALAGIEFNAGNLNKAELLCMQSLKINKDYPEAYSGIAVISARNGNYITADEMIKKGNFLVQKDYIKKNRVFIKMKLNEAAIALLKNEKERGYILLRSILSVDNNEKAAQLYNRYFIKK